MATTPDRILIATDFSPTAERAQSLALALGRAFGAQVHLLHVRVLLEDPHLEREEGTELERLLEADEVQRRAALDRVGGDAVEPAIHRHMVRGISAAEAIIESAVDLGCDLVLMGTHGRRGLRKLLVGSVAERVVRTSSVPVLVVRSHVPSPPETIRRILVPFDFSPHSEVAAQTAARWAEALGAGVSLLHVVEPVVYPEFYAVDVLPGQVTDGLQQRSVEALAEAADRLVSGVDCTTTVRVGRAVDVILSAADAQEHDLVVMGTRGLSGLEHLLLGSVAERVLRRSDVPVLTVHSEE